MKNGLKRKLRAALLADTKRARRNGSSSIEIGALITMSGYILNGDMLALRLAAGRVRAAQSIREELEGQFHD